ncbi:MAG: hypothetical protein HOO67_07910 [Candidatus Peribacteraceae bacterium]|nr:hypothetical protein [Candidatus Peribacteraceae bacterium]
MSPEKYNEHSESNLLSKLSVVGRGIKQMIVIYTLLFLCPAQKPDGPSAVHQPSQDNRPKIGFSPPRIIKPATPETEKKEPVKNDVPRAKPPDIGLRENEKINPTLHFEKVVKSGEALTEKFTQAKLNSVASEIDAAITESTKMIFVGESHWGTRPYYTQLIDKFLDPQKGVIFLEAPWSSQKDLDNYLNGKEPFDKISKVVNWKHIIDHAKDKKIRVILVDELVQRDQGMANNMDNFWKDAKPDRGIFFVGKLHLAHSYGDRNRVDLSIPELMAQRGWKAQSMVDIHFHNIAVGTDAMYSCDSMGTGKRLWSIPFKANLSKAIHFSGQEDPIIYSTEWIQRLKNPATNRTVHAIVHPDRKLEGKGW